MTHTLSELLEDIDARGMCLQAQKRVKKRILGSINPSAQP